MYDKFFAYLGELEESYRKLSDLLKRKMVALETENTFALDDILKEEQVYVLISKGFEGNLKTFRSELQFAGETLSQVIEELPEAEQPRFRGRFVTLRASLTEASALKDKCQGLIEERLQALDKAIRSAGGNPAPTYDSSGTTPGDNRPLLRTTI